MFFNVQLLSQDAKMPTRGTEDSAGIDFYSPREIVVLPQSDILLPLDVRVEFPKGYVLILKEKSGISKNKKLSVASGVIDADYRGNIHLHLFNYTENEVLIEKGIKIVQGLVMPVWTGSLTLVNEIRTDTERGEGGFGSTGV